LPLPACEAVTVHEPAPVIVIVDPFVPELEQLPVAANVTAFPEAPPVAETVNGASPNVLAGRAANVIDWEALVAVVVSVTCGAALKLALPAWSYLTVQTPVPLVIVKVAPEFVHDPELLYETGNPELAVAATVNCVLNAALAGAWVVTVIVWVWLAVTVNVLVSSRLLPLQD
jgi:hypothetical protein